MRRPTSKSLTLRTVIFAFVILTLEAMWAYNGEITQGSGIDVAYFVLPLIIASIILYGIAVADALFMGEAFQVLIRGILVFTVGLFFSLLILFSPYSGAQTLGSWFLLSVVVIVTAYILSGLGRVHKISSVRLISLSIALMILGCISLFELGSPFGYVIFGSFAISSGVCLLNLLSNSKNTYLRHIGQRAGSLPTILAVFLLSMFLLFYTLEIRPLLASAFSYYLLPFEWSVVCAVCILFYLNARTYVSQSLTEDLVLGKWTKLFQRIEKKKNELGGISKMVEKFIDGGSKEGIIVYLTSTLIENQASPWQTEAVIKELINYQDLPPPKLALLSRFEQVEQENRVRRRNVLQKTLMEAGDALRIRITDN